jgi:hypothetical protein
MDLPRSSIPAINLCFGGAGLLCVGACSTGTVSAAGAGLGEVPGRWTLRPDCAAPVEQIKRRHRILNSRLNDGLMKMLFTSRLPFYAPLMVEPGF